MLSARGLLTPVTRHGCVPRHLGGGTDQVRRTILTTAVVALWLASASPSLANGNSCTYDDGTAVATVTPLDGSTLIHHDGQIIEVDGVECGTLASVDTVRVFSAGDRVRIALEAGPFAPGKTDEGDGSSEIEFEIFGHVDLSIEGGDDAEHLAAAGSIGPGAVSSFLNLNASEPTSDADLTVEDGSLSSLQILLAGGGDSFEGWGWAPTWSFFFGNLTLLRMGSGNDRIEPAATEHAIYHGGPGDDTFSLRALGNCSGSPSLVRLPDRRATLCGTIDVSVAAFERVLGSDGPDFLEGTRAANVLRGAGGDDVLIASRGDDLLHGGPGRDVAVYAPAGVRVHADLRAGIALGPGTDRLVRLEGLAGSEKRDVLLGDAGPNELTGFRGNDELHGRAGPDAHFGDEGFDDCHQRHMTPGDTFDGCER
jgi:Ca2+-binding RTX toxin-like protein